MQIDYVCNFSSGSGYGSAGEGLVLAMDSVGLDVRPIDVRLTSRQIALHPRVAELAKKKRPADIVIQHTLPSLMDYRGGVKNIAYFANETNRLHPAWVKKLRLMDEIWVINSKMSNVAWNQGLETHIVPHAFDMNVFYQNWGVDPVLQKERDNGNFLFYTVCEFVRRKNLGALIKAFLAEFAYKEPVKLVLKVHKDGMNGQQVFEEVSKLINGIKDGLKKKSAGANCIVIADYCSQDHLYKIHQTCDCFVAPSFGESWHLGCAQALGFGKTPIVTGWSGFTDYINNDNGWLVDSSLEVCFGAIDSNEQLYTYRDDWAAVNVNDLRRCMREAYENKELRGRKASLGLDAVERFSYHSVGHLIKQVLNGEAR